MFLSPQASVSGSVSTLRYTIKNGGNEQQVNYSYTWPLNSWVHLAIRRLSDTVKMYVNGQNVASGTVTIKPSDLGTTTQNYIGKSQFADPLLKGAVDEFRIYNYALSDQNISNLANFLPLALTTAKVNVRTTVIKDDKQIRLYPNPVQQQLVIHVYRVNQGATFRIYNAVGVLVLSNTLMNNTTYLSMENLPAGMYYVQVTNGQQQLIKKMVKQ
jgi:hypothetical protein